MKGRKPILKEIAGGLAGVPRAPEHLSDVAAEEWRRVAPDLVARKILHDTALSTLAGYCMAVAGARKADESIAKYGMLIDTPAGPKANPAVRMATQFLEIARRHAVELGITPSARSRKGLGEKGGADDQDDVSQLGV